MFRNSLNPCFFFKLDPRQTARFDLFQNLDSNYLSYIDNPWTAEIKASSAKLIVLWQKHKQSPYERVRRELFLGDCSVPVRLTSLSLVTAPNEFCNTIQNIRIVFIIFTYNTIIDDIKSSNTKRRNQSLVETAPPPPDRMNFT